MTTTEISLPFISQGTDGPIHLNMSLTRAKFEDLISDLVESTTEPVRKALKMLTYLLKILIKYY